MSFGPKNSSGGGGGKHRRRRGRRGPGARPGQNKGQQQQNRHNQRNNPDGIYTSPMDHNYRNQQGGQQGRRGGGGLPSAYHPFEPEPLPANHQHGEPRIFCFIEDLFFNAKIQETGRKLNVKVEFVKTDKDILDRMNTNGNGEKPSLIIFDLNNLAAKPLQTIPKLKKELKKETTIIGFVSHVQGDLKLKAMEAGCDMVIPRSAFSQNLPQLLRRHGAPDEFDDVQ